MSAAKHTPGPWEIARNRTSIVEIGPCVADGYAGALWLDVQEADARLIAAAPELLEALELLFGTNAMHSVCRHEDADVFGRVKGTWGAKAEEKARAALAKAKGAAA